MNNLNQVFIYGAGGLGRELCQLCQNIGYTIGGYFDDQVKTGTKVLDHQVLGNIKDLNQIEDPVNLVVGIGDPHQKSQLVDSIANPMINLLSAIHPSVALDKTIKIAEGNIIAAGSILTVNVAIGPNVLINIGCTIGHDVKIGEFSSLMPGVNISGNVEIGSRCLIGTGAQILPGLKIGNDCKIGAGATVICDIPQGATAVGVPAKILKK